MWVGTAWAEITPNRPMPPIGQLHERMAAHSRDPLTANVVVFDSIRAQVSIVPVTAPKSFVSV